MKGVSGSWGGTIDGVRSEVNRIESEPVHGSRTDWFPSRSAHGRESVITRMLDRGAIELLTLASSFRQRNGAMNSSPLRTIARQAGVGALLVVVVALCSLLFSILGTLCTSVGTGLIMGASRRWKWQVVPVSLVFPLAGMTLAQAAKADLDERQRFTMAAVCFGSFWGVYLLTRFLLMLEKGGDTVASPGAVRRSSAEPGRNGAQARGSSDSNPRASDDATERPKPVDGLSLRDLQGTWLCETPGPDGQPVKRRLEITAATFALTVTNSGEQADRAAQGEIKLEGADGAKKLLVSSTVSGKPASPG
jgi:hypothetical protein